MRKLKTTDVFEAMRVIRKANVKEEMTPFIKEAAEGGKAVEDVGIMGILTLFEILSEKKAEQGIYDFLAGPFEMDPKEVANMDLTELGNKLKELREENDLKTFFTSLFGLITLK